MSEDFAARPVPIRLAYRYPNGCMVSYAARAVNYDGASLRAVVNEGFEEGVALSVMAPFLEGLTTGLVAGAARSIDQPGYYEITLRFENGNGSALAVPSQPLEERPKSEQVPAASAEEPREVERPAARKPPARAVPEAIALAAEELANGLYRLPVPRFSQVMQWTPPKSRPLGLLVAVAAAIHLLEEKGLVNTTHLFRTVKGARKR
ncbi:MAG TPA: hypothetical protein VIC04_04705 [Terriglobia bacterium]|jgi:hypothetical protein